MKDVNISVSKSYQAALNAEVPLPGGLGFRPRLISCASSSSPLLLVVIKLWTFYFTLRFVYDWMSGDINVFRFVTNAVMIIKTIFTT